MTDQPRPTLYEIVSLYDSRIIRGGLSEADARKWVDHLNRVTEHGAEMEAQA